MAETSVELSSVKFFPAHMHSPRRTRVLLKLLGCSAPVKTYSRRIIRWVR